MQNTRLSRHLSIAMGSLVMLCMSNAALWALHAYEPNVADPLLETWRWHHIEALDGLGLQCMAQEPNETMWFGLNEGVVRYDGLHWQRFSLDDGLTPFVKCILAMPDGGIYVQTAEAVHLYRDKRWITVLIQAYSGFPGQSMAADHWGGIWVACDQGLAYIEKDTASLVETVDGGVTTVFIDSHKQLWCLPSNSRVAHLAPLSQTHAGSLGETQSIALFQEDRIRQGSILEASDGRLWIVSNGSGDQVHIFDPTPQTWSRIDLRATLGRYTCTALAQTQDDMVWLVGQGRIYACRHGVQRIYDAPDLDIPCSPSVLLAGIDGSIWLGGRNAKVFRIDYSDQQYLTYRGLHFQCESPLGTYWFLEKTGAVVKYEAKRERWMRFDSEDGLPDAPVVMIGASNGSIWAAGSHQGQAAVAYYERGQWHRRLFPDLGFGISPYSVLESTSHDMIFGSGSPRDIDPSRGGGLLRFSLTDPSYPSEHLAYPLVPFRIVGIAQTDEGFWFGGSSLSRFDGRDTVYIRTPVSLAAGWVDHLTHTPHGDLWVAKGGEGMFRYDGESWKHYTMEHGLASNMVTYVQVHANGSLWAATDAGISCFDGDQWQPLAVPASFKLDRESGSLRVSADGTVWINRATRQWYFRALDPNQSDALPDDPYQTTRYKPDRAPPDTEIDYFVEQAQSASPVRISWVGHDAWSVTPQDQLLYAHRLDEGVWSPFTRQTSHTWYSLPAGSHVFEVRARDRDLNIDPTPARIVFAVLLPPWRQPWFLMVIGSLLPVIIFLILRLIRAHEAHVTLQLRHEKEISQQQLEMGESRLAFFTNISHELRTPLTLITGPMETLLQKLQDEDLKEEALLIKRNADRLLHLVNQLLDIRKLQAGKLQLDLAESDLIAFVRGIVASLQPIAQQKKLMLSCETDRACLKAVFDTDKLEKVLVNLISNAIKFTDEGGAITVTIEAQDKYIHLTVKDNGIGIPPDQREKIFERFHRVDAKGKTSGTGLGLSLARELVQLHGGTLSVESPVSLSDKERPGSRFIVKIPLERGESTNTEGPTSDQEEADQETDTLPTLLIIEDDTDMRHYIGSILTQEYRLLEAANGRQGLQLAQQEMPDLIVSDIMMPEMDGIELCRSLKNDENTSHIPILLLTAKGSEAAQVEGLETGADDYVIKPFSRAVLKARLANLLESRRRLQVRFQEDPSLPLQEITSNPVDERLLKRAVDIVEAHLADADFAMDEFSSSMHMSHSTLYRKIKALTGQSPSVFIRTIRLKHAAELLKTGHYRVSEVAYQVGFLEMTYFGRCFKRQFHCSPSQFMNQSRPPSPER